MRELQRRLDLSNGTLRHHLRLLELAGAVRLVADGQQRRVYPTDLARAAPVPPLDERALSLLRERGPMRAAELADALQVSRQALHYHVKRLVDEGRLVARREANEVLLSVA